MTESGEVRPIMADNPVLDHPPLLLKVRRTSEAFARGAITQRGMMMANYSCIRRLERCADVASRFETYEAGQMQDEHRSLDERQASCQNGVEGNRECDDGDREQRAMVVVPHVVWYLQGDQALNDRPAKGSATVRTALFLAASPTRR